MKTTPNAQSGEAPVSLPSDLERLGRLIEEVTTRHMLNEAYLKGALEATIQGFGRRGPLNAAKVAELTGLVYAVLVAAKPADSNIERFAEIAANVYFFGRGK